MEDKKGMD